MAMEMVTQLPYNHPYRWDGTLFGGPKLWRPTEISTALWLDAEDASTITLNGSTVSQWNDKSGNGRNATQATAVNQPTYVSSAINAKPALSFNGADDFLLGVNNIGLSGNPQFTLLTVQTAALSPGFSTWVSFGTNDYGSGFHWISNAEGTKAAVGYAYGVQFADASIVSPADPFIATINRTGTQGTNWVVRQNGAPVAVSATNDSAVSLIDAPVQIGRWVGGANFSAMQMAEAILIPSSVDTPTMQRLEGYLAWKWGLQANLPSDHPYKLLPPTV